MDSVNVGTLLAALGDDAAEGTAVLVGRLHNERKVTTVRNYGDKVEAQKVVYDSKRFSPGTGTDPYVKKSDVKSVTVHAAKTEDISHWVYECFKETISTVSLSEMQNKLGSSLALSLKELDTEGKTKVYKKHMLKMNDNKLEALDAVRKEAKRAKKKDTTAEKKPSKVEFLTKCCDLYEVP